MEYLIVIGICIIFLVILKFAWSIKISDIKKVKKIGYDKELNEITNKLPENKEICKYLLKKLNNEKVQLKESQDKQISMILLQEYKQWLMSVYILFRIEGHCFSISFILTFILFIFCVFVFCHC